MTALVGLHGRADGRMQAADLECVRVARVQAVKLLSTADPLDCQRLRTINPETRIIVRLFVDLSNRVISPADFVNAVQSDLADFYDQGVRDFEVHNEPNTRTEGWGASWVDGAGFGAWFTEVCFRLRGLHQGLSLGWPGLSPGADLEGVRADELGFLDQAAPAVSSADWIGIHCYWTGQGDMGSAAGGASYAAYLKRFAGKRFSITEFSIPSPNLDQSEKGRQYVQYVQGLPGTIEAAYSFVSSSSRGFESEAWRDEAGVLSAIPGVIGARQEPVMPELTRGIDVSSNQDPARMRYPDWRSRYGLAYGFYRVSIGTLPDPTAPAHRAGMRAAGMLTGPYHALHEARDPVEQARLLISRRGPDDEMPSLLDVERTALTRQMVDAFCDYYDAHSTAPLWIYAGKPSWDKIMGAGDRSRYARYGLVAAGYPFDAPEGPAGQPMDPISVALRSTPPANRTVAVGAPWNKWDAWQHTGHGHLDGYADFLDLEVFRGSEAELRARFSAPQPAPALPDLTVTHGSKLGLHSIRPQFVIPLMRRAKAHGYTFSVVKSVDSFGVAGEALSVDPRSIRTVRIKNKNPEWEAFNHVETWDDVKILTCAQESVNGIFVDQNGKSRTAEEIARAMFFSVCNEADPRGHYDAYGRALIRLCLEAERRGVRLCLPALNAGTPEWDDILKLVQTGLFAVMKRGGHILDLHEGVFGNDPVRKGYGDAIPGAPAVAGSGSLCFRYRYLYALLSARDEVVFAVVSEFYGGGGYEQSAASLLERIAWYDSQCRRDWWILGFCPFTIDPDETWLHADYSPFINSTELDDYMQAQFALPNAERGDTAMDDQLKQAIRDQANAAIARSAEATAASQKILELVSGNWWDALPTGVFPAQRHTHPAAGRLDFYHLPADPSPYTSRNYPDPASANIDVFERSGSMMRVTQGASVIWCPASQLIPFS